MSGVFDGMAVQARVEVAESLVRVGCNELKRLVSDDHEGGEGHTGSGGASVPESAPELAQTLLRIRRMIDDVVGGSDERAVKRLVVRSDAEVAAHEANKQGDLPQKLKDAYDLLYDKTYGPRGMQGLGDENAGQARDGVGVGRQMRLGSSGSAVYRAGAVTKSDKSKRNTVKDSEAFQFKRSVDKRLRRVAADIGIFLEGGRDAVVSGTKQCSRCQTFIARDAHYCGSCGEEVRA